MVAIQESRLCDVLDEWLRCLDERITLYRPLLNEVDLFHVRRVRRILATARRPAAAKASEANVGGGALNGYVGLEGRYYDCSRCGHPWFAREYGFEPPRGFVKVHPSEVAIAQIYIRDCAFYTEAQMCRLLGLAFVHPLKLSLRRV
jgi:hypothetical protein